MDITAKDLAAQISELVTFPDVAIKISEAIADDNVTLESVSFLIETDPALSAALLRLANSPTFNVGGTIESVQKAAIVVGLKGLRDLAFAISATHAFDGVCNDLITVEDFWKHSIYCACATQIVAQQANVCRGESLFTMGMLHDIGQLVMYSQCPEKSMEAILHSQDNNDGLSMYESEREIFGFDHMEVGAELAATWGFPQRLINAIAHHHDPYASEESFDTCIVVHAANSIAVLAELGSDSLYDAPPIDPQAREFLKLDDAAITKIVGMVKDQVEGMMFMFGGS